MWILKRDRDKLPTFCHGKYEMNRVKSIREMPFVISSDIERRICKTNYVQRKHSTFNESIS